MATVKQQVQAASDAIDTNIATLMTDRGFLSQNVLQYLRDLVEGLIVWSHVPDPATEFNYLTQFDAARSAAKASAQLRPLTRFHGLLQISASHYTLDRDPSERLMLKYYEYLLRTRDLAKQELGIDIVKNLELFPLRQDPALTAYYEQIAARIEATKNDPLTGKTERYYINGSRPFFINGRIYYEVTFSLAHNRTSKFDRVIGFTNIDITGKYAAMLELSSDSIEVLDQTMPIIIIRDWSVSIRPCEFDNFTRLFGQQTRVRSGHAEYRNLMRYLTRTGDSLLDLVDLPDSAYNRVKAWALSKTQQTPSIFPALDAARDIIRHNRPGTTLLRYLMLRMNNQVLKAQFDVDQCGPLSNMYVSHGCRPFDTMPFCTSPRGHNPRFADLAEAIDSSSRKHELLARRVRNNVEQHGMIYTPEAELEDLGDIDRLIARHNSLLPPNNALHARRRLQHANGHVFIKGYEDDTVAIIKKLQGVAAEGIDDHATDVQAWLDLNALLPDGDPKKVDDAPKAEALRGLFAESKVALVYGAAGTGKSTMVNHVANYFESEQKLFLAHTNPAVDNLRRRVDAPNTHFSTITKHLKSNRSSGHFGLVVIDECSTVSNANLLQVLEDTSFDMLVLVGDVYQIESIEFGNWFGAIRSYIPQSSVHELTHPYRTTDQALVTLWDRVRKLEDSIEESLAKNGYSRVLGASLFARKSDDEIVLCLNYDGLYGINNVNRFLQASNPNPGVRWGEAVYKVGDPVLFNETDRFRPVIFNNMKGTIVGIDRAPGRITFDVDIEREVTALDLEFSELRFVADTVVRFDVFERGGTDSDDDTVNTILPFQIAYAVSIHKAQGLEYDSVKVVITDANEENISHSIFYTAITRARKHLEVYWTPETEKRILGRLEVRENTKDENLLQKRRGFQPVAKREKRHKVRRTP